MYASAIDNLNGLMVTMVDPASRFNEDEDFGRLMKDMERQQVEGRAPLEGFVHILISAPQYPQPTAVWRKRFAEARERALHPVHFAVVSPSPLARAVVTAVSWVAPPKTGSSSAYSSFQEAAAAMEQRFKRKLPSLHRLHEEVLLRIKHTGGAAPAK